MEKPDEVIKMSIGELSIYRKNIASIVIIGRDIITVSDVKDVLSECNFHIGGKFALISNRVNEYSINPVELYNVLGSDINLKCAAVVSYRHATETLFPIEDTIKSEVAPHELPLFIFHCLEEAINWADKTVNL